jgi:hypothetical protein
MADEQLERFPPGEASRIRTLQRALSNFDVEKDMTMLDQQVMLEQARLLVGELQPLVQAIKNRYRGLMSDGALMPIVNATLLEVSSQTGRRVLSSPPTISLSHVCDMEGE